MTYEKVAGLKKYLTRVSAFSRNARRQRGFLLGGLGLYGYLIAGAAVVAVLSFIAYRIYQAGADSVRVEWAAAAEQQRQEEAERSGAASTRLEDGNAKARVIYRTIERKVDKVVDKVVYRNVCLDAAGLCLVNAAVRGEEPTACEPDKPLPAPGRAAGWDGGLVLALDDRISSPIQ